MPETFPPWISEAPKIILWDTQLLVAYIVGTVRSTLLGKEIAKGFSISDFDFIRSLVTRFKVLTTPFILSEVNSWLGKVAYHREELRNGLASMLPALREHYENSVILSQVEAFSTIGLTDSSIVTAAIGLKALVITTDWDLRGILIGKGVEVLHYDELKNFHAHLTF